MQEEYEEIIDAIYGIQRVENLPNSLYSRKIVGILKNNIKSFDKKTVCAIIARIHSQYSDFCFLGLYCFFTEIKIILLFSEYFSNHTGLITAVSNNLQIFKDLPDTVLKKRFYALYQSVLEQFNNFANVKNDMV
jgi:hypothetical protein